MVVDLFPFFGMFLCVAIGFFAILVAGFLFEDEDVFGSVISVLIGLAAIFTAVLLGIAAFGYEVVPKRAPTPVGQIMNTALEVKQ